jgi:aspartyl-tRNA(Asn)/glutamyl-tRNA(Gln) amidotransferase subunit B
MAQENKELINGGYETVIGLETHVELSTATKMFCGCELSFGAEPNSCTCPVCLGHPGTLPVINEKAILYAIKIALALNCSVNKYTIFHRKNYFYPDMPKNYQISQYDLPVGSNGYLDVDMGDYTRRVGITRVHLEEDTGKLIHTGSTGRISESASSIVDFNRAGTPLVEIVTEPDIRSATEAKEYLVALRNLLLYLDVSDCSMEEGSLRCDANVSVRPAGSESMGTKTEIKNLNSFRFMQRGLEYEVSRQTGIVSSGGRVIQQTRHYDNVTDSTKALRTKEEAHDYRYFPEPDLVPMHLDEEQVGKLKEQIPELPGQKSARYISDFGLSFYDAKFLTGDRQYALFFEECMKIYKNAKAVANWLMGDFSALLNKESLYLNESKINAAKLVRMLELIDSGKISSKIAKSVFEEMFYKGTDPAEVIAGSDLEQISDEGELEVIIDEVIKSNPGPVAQLKEGKEKAIGFLVGQVMAHTKGKANPRLVNEIIMKKIK